MLSFPVFAEDSRKPPIDIPPAPLSTISLADARDPIHPPDCPVSDQDYQAPVRMKRTPHSYQTIVCPGYKIEVVAALAVLDGVGIMHVPGEDLPWEADFSGLSDDMTKALSDQCRSDMPCVARFKLTITGLDMRETPPPKPGEWREGDQNCKYGEPARWCIIPTDNCPLTRAKSCYSSAGTVAVRVTLDGVIQ